LMLRMVWPSGASTRISTVARAFLFLSAGSPP